MHEDLTASTAAIYHVHITHAQFLAVTAALEGHAWMLPTVEHPVTS